MDTSILRRIGASLKKEVFFIRHNPGDTVYGSWGDFDPHDRKKRVSWKIYRKDSFVFNYDQISLDDIEFYLNSRVNREYYYTMIPQLLEFKKNRLIELAWEKDFAKMLLGSAQRKYSDALDMLKCEAFIAECIEWWKLRVIVKRPITKNDTLALNMIEKRVLAESNKKRVVKKQAVEFPGIID